MLFYFADESGDPGFKPGASRVFCVCLVRIEGQEARKLGVALSRLRESTGLAQGFEFKWAKTKVWIRRQALVCALGHRLEFRARVWRKRAKLDLIDRSSAEAALLATCLADFGPLLTASTLVFDGQRDRVRAARLRQALAPFRALDGSQAIGEVRLQDSRQSHMLQVVDLLVGGIAALSVDPGNPDVPSELSRLADCWRDWP